MLHSPHPVSENRMRLWGNRAEQVGACHGAACSARFPFFAGSICGAFRGGRKKQQGTEKNLSGFCFVSGGTLLARFSPPVAVPQGCKKSPAVSRRTNAGPAVVGFTKKSRIFAPIFND
jgi:hypothetical protein